MDIMQILANGIVLGALYACIAVGFSLVWGVLNVINMLHGSFIILGGYLTYFAWHYLGINPIVMLPAVALVLFVLGYGLQYLFINKVVSAPVLTTLTLTFGLDMILYNLMTVYFTATPRRVTMDLGNVDLLGVVMPVDLSANSNCFSLHFFILPICVSCHNLTISLTCLQSLCIIIL